MHDGRDLGKSGSHKSSVCMQPIERLAILQTSLPRKASKLWLRQPVPQTDTGGRVEKTKTNK
jgi:hypothetical protein